MTSLQQELLIKCIVAVIIVIFVLSLLGFIFDFIHKEKKDKK